MINAEHMIDAQKYKMCARPRACAIAISVPPVLHGTVLRNLSYTVGALVARTETRECDRSKNLFFRPWRGALGVHVCTPPAADGACASCALSDKIMNGYKSHKSLGQWRASPWRILPAHASCAYAQEANMTIRKQAALAQKTAHAACRRTGAAGSSGPNYTGGAFMSSLKVHHPGPVHTRSTRDGTERRRSTAPWHQIVCKIETCANRAAIFFSACSAGCAAPFVRHTLHARAHRHMHPHPRPWVTCIHVSQNTVSETTQTTKKYEIEKSCHMVSFTCDIHGAITLPLLAHTRAQVVWPVFTTAHPTLEA